MRIGIIGAGNMGATLAAQLTQLGHQVAIANSRGPQTLTGGADTAGGALRREGGAGPGVGPAAPRVLR
jgi:8-hydroxy-5-deazaflavin:NADPH oxidoreductase